MSNAQNVNRTGKPPDLKPTKTLKPASQTKWRRPTWQSIMKDTKVSAESETIANHCKGSATNDEIYQLDLSVLVWKGVRFPLVMWIPPLIKAESRLQPYFIWKTTQWSNETTQQKCVTVPLSDCTSGAEDALNSFFLKLSVKVQVALHFFCFKDFKDLLYPRWQTFFWTLLALFSVYGELTALLDFVSEGRGFSFMQRTRRSLSTSSIPYLWVSVEIDNTQLIVSNECEDQPCSTFQDEIHSLPRRIP